MVQQWWWCIWEVVWVWECESVGTGIGFFLSSSWGGGFSSLMRQLSDSIACCHCRL